MGTATCRGLAAIVLAGLAAATAGCGGTRSASGASSSAVAPAGALSALAARPAPVTWRAVRIPSGALLSYPAGWRLARGDAGSATAIARDAHGAIVGYLNATPRQSNETLSGWSSFRVAHNVREGERDVRREASRQRVRFLDGRGTCVQDSYTTTTRARYVELACLVQGSTASTVIVAATTPQRWAATVGLLERAVSAFRS